MMKIIFEDKDLYTKTAEVLKNSIDKILLKKDKVILGLPGGRSISPVIESLKKLNVPWEKIHVFMVDERLVPINNKDSNFRLIRQGLGDVINPSNLHPFIYDKTQKDFGLKAYEDEIKKYGGAYDIILVSSGEDGHIAALYPNHPSSSNQSDYYFSMDDSPKPPKDRMTMSRKMLLKSKIGILLFSGDIKKEAYVKFLDKTKSFTECPAKLIQQLPESYVVIDIKL